jgi:hypothetical protein
MPKLPHNQGAMVLCLCMLPRDRGGVDDVMYYEVLACRVYLHMRLFLCRQAFHAVGFPWKSSSMFGSILSRCHPKLQITDATLSTDLTPFSFSARRLLVLFAPGIGKGRKGEKERRRKAGGGHHGVTSPWNGSEEGESEVEGESKERRGARREGEGGREQGSEG